MTDLKRCDCCKKIMTREEQVALTNAFHYTYCKEVEFDYICDSCDAKGRARACIRSIVCDMQKHIKEARKGEIVRPTDYLKKHLTELRVHWIKHYTEFLSYNTVKTEPYWEKIFNEYVYEKTAYLSEPARDEKIERTNY